MSGSEARFDDRVDDYVKHRPSYPAEVIDFVEHALELAPQSVVADLGSGTGIFSALLVERGLTVVGVEPSAPMRASAERALGASARFTSIGGTAEATTLPAGSVDAIVAAQAFHWFDVERARDECRRILRPSSRDATVALVWNVRREIGTPFLEGYEQLLLEKSVDYARVRHQAAAEPAMLARFFDTPPRRWSTPSVQQLSWQGLRGRAASSSYVPAPGDARHAAFFDQLRALFERTSNAGVVRFEYDVDVWCGRVGDDLTHPPTHPCAR